MKREDKLGLYCFMIAVCISIIAVMVIEHQINDLWFNVLLVFALIFGSMFLGSISKEAQLEEEVKNEA